jgi:hypothetical protein
MRVARGGARAALNRCRDLLVALLRRAIVNRLSRSWRCPLKVKRLCEAWREPVPRRMTLDVSVVDLAF